ncbi:CD44 antigen isoform X3 [Amia ocellicauda]|uniref:CD44 antigen isoform X3 n=1 Tax=Amia ocellicauda TaxID=2972642 RepID=UPI0034646AF6
MIGSLLPILACGLIAFASSCKAQALSVSCSHAGVFHIELNSRYNMTYSEADELCQSLGTVLANAERIHVSFSKGFQTCRYGWIQNNSIAILRRESHPLCASNGTGVYIITDNLQVHYDAYCFNSSDPSDRNCASAHNPIPHTIGAKDDGYEFQTTDTATVFFQKENSTSAPLPDDAVTGQLPEGIMTTPVVTKENLGDKDENESPHDETTTITNIHTVPKDTGSGRMGPGNVTPSSPTGKTVHGVPDWLIILAVVVAVAVIFLVCVAVATRHRWCGKKQKLVITSKASGRDGNGMVTATHSDKEQEMVQLMNKEKIQDNVGNGEEFTVITLEESPEKSHTA